MRLFTAITLSPEHAETLAQFSRKARAYTGVRKENFHITLNFLGELDAKQTKKIVALARSQAKETRAFNVVISKIIKKKDMLWAVLEKNTALLELQKHLSQNFVIERLTSKPIRVYFPHIKIGFTGIDFIPKSVNLSIPVKKFELLETHFNPDGGVEYTEAASFPLHS